MSLVIKFYFTSSMLNIYIRYTILSTSGSKTIKYIYAYIHVYVVLYTYIYIYIYIYIYEFV